MKCTKEKGILHFKDETRGEAKFSLIDGSMYIMNGYGEFEKRKSLSSYFAHLRIGDINDWFDKDDEVLLNLLKMVSDGNWSCRSINTFLQRMMEYSEVEKLMACGIKVEGCIIPSYLKGFKFSDINKEILSFYRDNNIKIWKGHFDFLGNKNLLTIFRAYKELGLLDEFKQADWLEIFYYRSSVVDELLNVYNYNPKSLIKYFEYMLNYECVSDRDIISYLRDYYFQKLRMSRKNKGIPSDKMKIDGSIEKYPKYLKSVHDIVSKQYKTYKKDYDEELFLTMYNDIDFVYEDKKYCIVTPKCTFDVVEEGMELKHCVKSYIDYVLNGKCHIIFMREINNPNTPFITLEVRNNKIVQTRGFEQRLPVGDEAEFLRKYCKNKNFELTIA